MATANPDKLKLVREVSRQDILLSISRLPGSTRAFLGSSDSKVYDLDLAEAKPEAKALSGHASYVTGVAAAGKVVVSGGYDGKLIWWDTTAGMQIRSIDAHTKWIRRVTATRDGKVVASIADDMVCRLWDAESGKPIRDLRGHQEKTPHHFPSMLYGCTFSADGKHLATVDKVGHVVVWETATGKQLSTLEVPGMYTWDPVQRRHSIGGPRSLAFSPDGKLLAVGGIGKIGNIDHLDGKARIEVFDWAKKEQTCEHVDEKFKGLINYLVFHPQGDWLLGAGGAGDGFMVFLDLKTKKAVRQEKVSMHVHDLSLGDEADTIYAVGHRKIAIFEMKG